jgi:hypothetical protein
MYTNINKNQVLRSLKVIPSYRRIYLENEVYGQGLSQIGGDIVCNDGEGVYSLNIAWKRDKSGDRTFGWIPASKLMVSFKYNKETFTHYINPEPFLLKDPPYRYDHTSVPDELHESVADDVHRYVHEMLQQKLDEMFSDLEDYYLDLQEQDIDDISENLLRDMQDAGFPHPQARRYARRYSHSLPHRALPR